MWISKLTIEASKWNAIHWHEACRCIIFCKWPRGRHVLIWQFVQCCRVPAWSSSQKRWSQKRLSPSCSRWPLGTWWRVNLDLESMRSGWVFEGFFISVFLLIMIWFDFFSLTFIPSYILNLHLPHLCHVAQHSEDHKPWHKAGQTIHQTCHDGITVEEEINPVREPAAYYCLYSPC